MSYRFPYKGFNWLYLATDGDVQKIGIAKDISKRYVQPHDRYAKPAKRFRFVRVWYVEDGVAPRCEKYIKDSFYQMRAAGEGYFTATADEIAHAVDKYMVAVSRPGRHKRLVNV